MSDYVTRIARAMFRVGKEHWPTAELQEAEHYNWKEFEDHALAALEAASEPDEAMIEAGMQSIGGSELWQQIAAEEIFRSMIKQALEGK